MGPYRITHTYTNGTVRIQRGVVNERVNIRRLTPYKERALPNEESECTTLYRASISV
jgi:hypothetical protein